MDTEIFRDNPAGITEILAESSVGIAGAGGIGSNVALALTRAGIGRLVVADHDLVELRNLNRQQYFRDQIGMPKATALKDSLRRINPDLDIEVHQEKIESGNACSLFNGCSVLVEALDSEKEKVMLLEAWLEGMREVTIVACSGIAGYGHTELLRVDRRENLILVGDQQSDLESGTLSARVAAVANMMANEVIDTLCN